MAKITGHKVRAYDDWIVGTPHGQEFIASPDGSVKEGTKYPAFKGTWPYYWYHGQKKDKFREKLRERGSNFGLRHPREEL